MVGKGAVVFAVMGYVIANMRPSGSEEAGWQMVVELNPRLLAFILGEPEAEVAAAVDLLCSPDPESRTKDKEGRRLLRTGQFDYLVVNGWKYRSKRDPDKRRQQNREAQTRFRARKREQNAYGSGNDVANDAELLGIHQKAAKSNAAHAADLQTKLATATQMKIRPTWVSRADPGQAAPPLR